MTEPRDINIRFSRYGREILFSGRFKEAIFGSELVPLKIPDGEDENFVTNRLDSKNSYNFNNYGFRGPDFEDGVDILAAGCSQTYGIGVPENGTWPAMLSKMSGKSYANLSVPGASIQWIVNNIISYIETFGKPKHIFVLFPDVMRIEAVMNKDVNISLENGYDQRLNEYIDNDREKAIMPVDRLDVDLSVLSRLSRRPHAVENVTPPEEAIYRSIKSIRMLESYCEVGDIDLYWGTWCSDFANFLFSTNNKYSKYSFKFKSDLNALRFWESNKINFGQIYKPEDKIIDYKYKHLNSLECTDEMFYNGECQCKAENCHIELEDYYPSCFHIGDDRFLKGVDDAHFGVHKHMHLAEEFFKHMNGEEVV